VTPIFYFVLTSQTKNKIPAGINFLPESPFNVKEWRKCYAPKCNGHDGHKKKHTHTHTVISVKPNIPRCSAQNLKLTSSYNAASN